MTVQLRNIRPFSQYQPGDVVEVPDGAAFDDFHWERVAARAAAPPVPAVPVLAPPAEPKEM
jgi:hypothetical protein